MCDDRYLLENAHTEALLKKSEERYRNIVETSQEGIYILDQDYKIVFVNRKMAEMLEWMPEDMIGKSSLEFVNESEKEVAIAAMERRKRGIHEILEWRLKTKTGKEIRVSSSATAIMLEDGKFSGILALATDVTERYNALEALKKSELQLREAQKIARLGNYNYNFKTNKWSCSKIVDELSGLTPDEIPHIENWIALIAPEFRQEYVKDLEDAIVHGRYNFGPYQDYKIIQAHTGEVRWISITGEMIYDENGAPEYLFGTLQDVTERKKEEELMQMNDQLRNYSDHLQTIREEERLNIAREIHDELGQQLTAIKIDIARWRNRLKVQYPDLNTDSTVELVEMVNNAISSVRRIATELRPGLLNELGIEAAIELYTSDFAKRTGIKCAFESNLEKDNYSKAVNTAIFRIYQETLTNVARHAQASEVNTRFYSDHDMLVLEVKDNGIGISDERLNNKTSLGLMGMRERAGMLRGEINFRKLDDCGTLVTLRIPSTS
jgi:PAS domain S-box-containing protein